MPSAIRVIQVLISLLAGVGVFLGGSKYGLGLSPDGISYLAAAHSLQQGLQLVDYDGAVFAAWPPLYPILLALGGLLTGDVQGFAKLLNVVCCTFITFAVFESLIRSGVGLITTFLLSLSVAVSFPLLKNGVMLWSESVFTAHLLLCFLLIADNNLEFRKNGMILLAVLLSLLPLQRYLGVSAIVTFILFQSIKSHRFLTFNYARTILGYSILLVPLIFWCLRNKLLTGHLTGPRAPSTVPFFDLMWRLYDVGGGILTPLGLSNPFLTISKFFLFSLVVLSLLRIGYKVVVESKKKVRSTVSSTAELHALFICVYVGTLCLGILLVGLEPLSIRYLSPIIPSAFIVIGTQIPTHRKWQTLSLFALIPLTLQSVSSCATIVAVWQEEGAGDYSVRGWKESQILSWLRVNPLEGRVFSNASDFVFVETGQLFSRLPAPASLVSGEFAIDSEIKLIFFAKGFRRYMARREDFTPYCTIRPLAQFVDGGVYSCTPENSNRYEKPLP